MNSGEKFCSKDTKRPKDQTVTFEEHGVKAGVRSKNRVLHMSPAHNATREAAKALSCPSHQSSGHTPIITPQKEEVHPLREQASKGTCWSSYFLSLW